MNAGVDSCSPIARYALKFVCGLISSLNSIVFIRARSIFSNRASIDHAYKALFIAIGLQNANNDARTVVRRTLFQRRRQYAFSGLGCAN